MTEISISNVRLLDGREVDVLVDHGVIERVVARGTGSPQRIVDGGGGLCVRPLTDAHLHLDKAGTAEGLEESPETIADAIRVMSELKRGAQANPGRLRERMSRVVENLAKRGTRFLRAVVDVDETWGLTSFEAATEVRSSFAGRVGIAVVAFPQEGMTPAVVDMMRDAAARGADAIGAHTDLDEDFEVHIRTAAAIAREARLPLEVHVDEVASNEHFRLPVVLEAAVGLSGLSLVHCLSLGQLDEADQDFWIDRIRDAGAVVVVAPSILSFGLPLAPVRRLLAGGVPVLFGSDNLQDVFFPLGTGSVLGAARAVATVAGLTTPGLARAILSGGTNSAFASVTRGAGGLDAGTPASFVVFSGPDAQAVLRGDDEVRIEVLSGRVREKEGGT